MHRFSNLFLALALAAALGAAPAAADNRSLFLPFNNTGILSYFKSIGNNKPSLETSYVLQVATPGIVFIVIGIIAFVTYAWWSCCGCSCCVCCKKGNEVDCFCCSEKTAKFVYIFMALACAGGIVGCGIYGLEVNALQEKGFRALGPAGQALDAWTKELAARIAVQSAKSDTALETLNANLQGDGLKSHGPSITEFNLVVGQLELTKQTLAALSNGINGLQLSAYSARFDSLLKPVNEYRELGLLIAISVLLGLVFLQLAVAMMNMFCADSLKPNECCLGRILQGTITALFLLALLVAFFVFGALLFVTAVPADICSDPAEVIGFTGMGESFTYFIECSAMNETQKAADNPFAKEIDVLNKADTLLDTQWQNLLTAASGCNTPECTLQKNQGSIDIAAITLTGITATAGCTSLNSLWNVVANSLCGTVGEGLASTTLLMGAISFIMLITEPVRRKLNEIYMSEDNKTV